jgi:hypothetical protein
MAESSNKQIEFEDFSDLLFKHPDLANQIAILECSLQLFKFADLSKCSRAADKLNKFFEGDVLNAIMFQNQKPDEANMIKGTFFASLPLSERNFDLFLDMLVLNLISAGTIAFDDKIVIRTEKEKYVIQQKITIDH